MATHDLTSIRKRMEAVHQEHGEWTAMAIHLGDGLYTTPKPAQDHRLRRLVQVAQDVSRKPLDQCRVLDLACLEGHYAVEFAARGAEALGIEGRLANHAKCEFTKEVMGLDKLSFARDDVRNLSRETYGSFDVVICSGILYHLDAPDVFRFVEAIGEVCSGITLIDTYVSVRDEVSFEFKGKTYHGRYFEERPADHSDRQHQAAAWASIDNARSVWITRASLYNLLCDVGFTSVMEVHLPPHPDVTADRITLVAIKGVPAEIRTSPVTAEAVTPRGAESPTTALHPSQYHAVLLRQKLKHYLPTPLVRAFQIVKRTIKGKPAPKDHDNPWEWEIPWKKRGGA
jgi:2-polyprenyl-3-methyl-5-hydroxy-6-metoxy-1,4-benzoquinol methylase